MGFLNDKLMFPPLFDGKYSAIKRISTRLMRLLYILQPNMYKLSQPGILGLTSCFCTATGRRILSTP